MHARSGWLARSLAAAAVLATTWPLAAFSASPPTIVIRAVDTSAFPEIQLTVAATGTDGLPLLDAQRQNFEVFEDGQPVQIADIKPDEDTVTPISVVLALDTGARMTGDSLTAAQLALGSFVDRGGAGDPMALLAFGNPTCQMALGQSFTTDKAQLKHAIANVHSEGRTPLYDAAFIGLKMTRDLPPIRKAMILMTNGGDDCSSVHTADDVAQEASNQAVPIFAIGIGPNADATVLQRFADVSGGRYFPIKNAGDELPAVYAELNRRLRTQYRLTYRTGLLADRGQHTLTARIHHNLQMGTAPEAHYTTPSLALKPVTNVADGQQVAAPTTLEVSSETPVQITRVDFYLDTVLVGSATRAPFALALDPAHFSTGPHTLRMVATSPFGETPELTRQLQFQGGWPIDPNTALLGGLLLLPLLAIVGVVVLSRRHRPVEAPKPTPALVGGVVFPPPAAPQPLAPSPRDFAIHGETSDAPPPPTLADDAPGGPDGQETLLLTQPPRTLSYLAMSRGSHSGQQYSLADGDVSIGRDPNCTVVVDDPAASKQHARVRRVGRGFQITDLDSTNGTLVNGERVVREVLQPGDRITIGGTELVFMDASRTTDGVA